jgi:hypothetical protein
MSYKYREEVSSIGEKILTEGNKLVKESAELPVDFQIAELIANLHHLAAKNHYNWKDVIARAGRYYLADLQDS